MDPENEKSISALRVTDLRRPPPAALTASSLHSLSPVIYYTRYRGARLLNPLLPKFSLELLRSTSENSLRATL